MIFRLVNFKRNALIYHLNNLKNMKQSTFLTPATAKSCIDLAGSPCFVYHTPSLRDSAKKCLAFPNAFGLTVRYAMKACPNANILKLFS